MDLMPKIIEGLRERIIDELERLMIEDGSEPGLRTLAERAGVAVGTLYNYFPDKDDLIKALFQREWSRTLERLRDELDSAAGAGERASRLASVVYASSEIIAGSMERRKQLIGGEGRGGRRHAPPYPFRAEGWRWLCGAFAFVWNDYFGLEGPGADRMTILLVSAVPRLIQLFPGDRENNIKFVRGMIVSGTAGAVNEQE